MRLRTTALSLLLSATPGIAAATGFGGNDAPTRVPVPAKDVTVTVVDLSGTEVTVNKASFDGEVHVFGDLGVGRLAVSFVDIDTMRIEPSDESGKRVAFLTMRDGQNVRMVVDGDVPCYGVTTHGNYKIDLEQIRKITFHPAP